jgi:arylsulfate sulfotransferase
MKPRVRSWGVVRPSIRSAYLQLRLALVLGLGIFTVGAIVVFAGQGTRTEGMGSSGSTAGVTVSPNMRSGQPVGTSIIWHASAPELKGPVYQFSVTAPGGQARMVRDFSAGSAFTWTPLREGRYIVTAIAKSGFAGTTTTKATATFTVVSRVAGSSAVVSATGNPLVALYSAPACASGTLTVQFRLAAGSPPWQSTAAQPCHANQSVNVLVAGMRPHTKYVLRHIVTTGNSHQNFAELSFTTGVPPAGLKIADFTVEKAPTSQADLALPVIFHSLNVNPSPSVANPIATDLNGNLIWYYDTLHTGLVLVLGVHILPGGTFLLIGRDANRSIGDDVLRQIDLAGDTVQETNIEAISAQLAKRGQERIYSFHHDALQLPNGDTAVFGAVQRRIGDHVIQGDMVIVLDASFQVAWTWDTFDHLTPPAKLPAGLGDMCTGANAAKRCALPDLKAYDWTHANGLSWSPEDDDLTVSFRNLDLTIKIAYQNGHGNGAIVWRLGKGDDFTIKSSNPSPWFSHQHNVTYVSNDTITLFDNGNTRCNAGQVTGCESRGQVYKLDEQQHVATELLSVNLGTYWQALGSAQELPNGDFMFAGGFAPPSKEDEFSPDGTEVYELDTPLSEYRAYRLTGLSF